MSHDGCNLDQWLTSAMAAMAFASQNWRQFCEETEKITHDPVPITAGDMLHHAQHLSDLADPDRMPA